MNKILSAVKTLKWYEAIMCIIMIGIAIFYAIQPDDVTPQWLAIINLISGLCGVMCIFLCAKANRMNFPFAVVNTTVFMIYLYYFGIWATFWLELCVYFPMNIISWYKWYNHKDNEDELLVKSKKLNWWQMILVFAAIIGVSLLAHYTLSAVAGNTWMRFAENFGWNIAIMQWLDCSIFAIGIVAVVLEMLRFTEQYYLWLITDVIAVAQYLIKVTLYILPRKWFTWLKLLLGLRIGEI